AVGNQKPMAVLAVHRSTRGGQLNPGGRFECQTALVLLFFAGATSFGFSRIFFNSEGGSPSAALRMSPPSSRAISISNRLVTTDRGASSVMSSLLAHWSRCLIISHAALVSPGRPRVRTSTHEPRSFFPSSENLSSPFFSPAPTF